MALSNMNVEPRREITESVVGIGALVLGIPVVGGILYGSALILNKIDHTMTIPQGMALSILLIPMTIAVLALLAYFSHFVGEEICDVLAKRKLDPRPTQRYEMRYVWDSEAKDHVRKRVAV